MAPLFVELDKLPFIYRHAGSGKPCGPLSSEKLKHVNRPLKAKDRA